MSKVDDILRMQLIGACCRDHRKNVLHLTLEQFQQKTGVNYKTISNFENGRSGNLYYMFYYIDLTPEVEKVNLLERITNIRSGAIR